MIIGTFSGPPAPDGGSASAVEYSTIQELLYQMPDNSANLIQAKNVRNSIYTLWERISDVQTVASQSASASVIYSNSTPTPRTLGGITASSTFTNQTMIQMWDSLLYPYIAPEAILTTNSPTANVKEYGESSQVALTWTVIKGSENLVSIYVPNGTYPNTTVVVPNQTPSQSASIIVGSQINIDTEFVMTVSDGISTITGSQSINWTNKRYWGTLPVGHALVSPSIVPFSHANISSFLSNELISPTSSNVYTQTRTITTNNDYVVFIWPHDSVNLSTNPTHVSISGLGNNNWVKTRNNVQFTNGTTGAYTGTNYDVWVFGNTQAPNTFTYVIT